MLSSSKRQGGKKTWDADFSHSELRLRGFERERELLSKNTQDPTVGGLRSKKGKRSTRSRLRVDPGFVEFPQTPSGRISPYLGFIPIIKCFTNVSVVWGREGPFDRSQNLGPNL